MASLLQIFAGLGACPSSEKNFNTSCIAQLYNKRHFSNLVANHQISKPKFPPLALVGQKKLVRDYRKQCQKEKWKAWCSDDGSCGVAPQFLPPHSQVDIVLDFYNAFNTKDSQRLEQLLSPDCVYQDLVFYGPYEGKENVINFLRSAMDAMGPNIHISMEEVTDGGYLKATALWHLEWKTKKIPFTNGCRFFTFEEVEGRLFISQITGVEELPVKPGELVLKLLKAIRTLFDRYPLAAEAILDSHVSQDGTHEGMGMHFDLFGRKY